MVHGASVRSGLFLMSAVNLSMLMDLTLWKEIVSSLTGVDFNLNWLQHELTLIWVDTYLNLTLSLLQVDSEWRWFRGELNLMSVDLKMSVTWADFELSWVDSNLRCLLLELTMNFILTSWFQISGLWYELILFEFTLTWADSKWLEI